MTRNRNYGKWWYKPNKDNQKRHYPNKLNKIVLGELPRKKEETSYIVRKYEQNTIYETKFMLSSLYNDCESKKFILSLYDECESKKKFSLSLYNENESMDIIIFREFLKSFMIPIGEYPLYQKISIKHINNNVLMEQDRTSHIIMIIWIQMIISFLQSQIIDTLHFGQQNTK